MPYRVEVSREDGYLRLEVFGRRNVADTRDLLRTIALEATHVGERNLLLVNRLEGRLDTIDIYDLLSKFRDFGLMPHHRIAALYPDDDTHQDGVFGATVMQNRGGFAEAFTNEKAALQWLLGNVPAPDAERGPLVSDSSPDESNLP